MQYISVKLIYGRQIKTQLTTKGKAKPGIEVQYRFNSNAVSLKRKPVDSPDLLEALPHPSDQQLQCKAIDHNLPLNNIKHSHKSFKFAVTKYKSSKNDLPS